MGLEFPINEYGNKLFLQQIKEDQDEGSTDRLKTPLFFQNDQGLHYQQAKVSYHYPLEDFNSVMKEIADA
jgi:hypothetical protein